MTSSQNPNDEEQRTSTRPMFYFPSSYDPPLPSSDQPTSGYDKDAIACEHAFERSLIESSVDPK